MQTNEQFLLEEISIQERAAVRNAFNRRMGEICAQPHAPLRAHVHCAALIFAAAQAVAELEGPEVAAATLRKLADGLDRVQ
jgi:RNase P protein component